MVKPRIYVETSVISYLAARPSADAVSNARQFQSHCLWQARDRFELFASEAVQAECLAGDAQAARLRAEYVQQLPILQARTQAAALAQQSQIGVRSCNIAYTCRQQRIIHEPSQPFLPQNSHETCAL